VASQLDAELVRRARDGDESALVEIYDQCQAPVYRYVYYRVGDAALAEELTAEVFVRVVGKIGTIREQGRPILAWLYVVARNLVTDHRRRQGRVAHLPLDESMAAGEEGQPAAVAEVRELEVQLRAALDALTEPQRQVILLKFMEARSNAEVAEILGKDLGSVKSLQHRALAALRRVLSSHGLTGAVPGPD
jgi:RNA polymerase sigma-70 factor, ECF subfamily